MNGAESLVHTLLKSGVNTCFANPGTSEMHFVAALDRIPGMRCVLGLFEGVVTGAADGYSRITGKPAATLLHCGPGLANGMACLHNARRAQSSIVNIVGDQANYHRPLDPPLTAETETWARGVSAWARTSASAAALGADAAEAVQAARTSPGQIATLVAPSDTCWDEGGVVATALEVPPVPKVSADTVRNIAKILRSGEPAMLVIGGPVIRADRLALAHSIAEKTKARLLAQQYNARVERGQGRYAITRIPYVIDLALPLFAGIKHLILLGAREPVAFFAYPGKPNRLYPDDATMHVFAQPDEDITDALAQLADELGVKTLDIPNTDKAEYADGAINPESFGRAVAALIPDDAIISDESVSFGRMFFPLSAHARPHDWLQTTMGGAIGQGLPVATGAAIAAPDRRVIALQADGSAMFTLQSLWTQAREKLDVTTVILSNRKYQILLGEYSNVGANPGRTAMDMLDIGNPDLDWVKLANGMGVEAATAGTIGEFADLFQAANKRRGPFVIELLI